MTAPRRAFWTRLWPVNIAGQLAVLVLVAILAIHAVLTASFLLRDRTGSPPGEATGRLAAVVEMIDRTALADRPALVATLAATFPQFRLGLVSPGATLHEDLDHNPTARHLARALGTSFSVAGLKPDGPAMPPGDAVAVRLRDHWTVTATLPHRPPPRGGPLLATFAFLLISTVLLGAWAILALTKPLRGIAAGVEAYGPGNAPQPLPETGPAEIRTVARAFNRMQERITRLVDDRTRALAAVSHDLRTPITRLRLRAEFVEDAGERARLIADLDQMDALVQSALTHLRDGRSDEPMAVTDLQSLAQTVADRFADLGHDVPVTASERLAVRARPLELERVIANLVDNACKYGAAPRIVIRRENGEAVIEVIDSGPGIPVAKRAEAMEPFVRGEAARTMNERDGFGLGLTIARAIAEAHGGALHLLDAENKGLVARVTLPLA